MRSRTVRLNFTVAGIVGNGLMLAAGCSGPAASPGETAGAGITPEKFADAVHAVMMADRTVYATHVVTHLKNQEAANVKPSEYWQEEENKIPLPAQMFRMGAELVADDPEAGFSYALKSKWPLNPQNKAKTDLEMKGLEYLAERPGETYSDTEELGGARYFTKFYPDRAVAEACWACHNAHANRADDYPEFKEGDVMGGVIVRVPIQ